jgi:hypothetical protein
MTAFLTAGSLPPFPMLLRPLHAVRRSNYLVLPLILPRVRAITLPF